MAGGSVFRVRRVAISVVFMVVAVVGGAVIAGASTPDLPPNARDYEAVCHRPGTERQRTLILRERAADFFTRRLGAVDAPCGAPLPPAAEGVAIDPAKGYFVEEIDSGLYWVTEGVYQMMFLTTGEGVVVVDAPPTIGPNILAAIAEVTDEPITHVIYSHSHADHIGAAGLYPADAVVIAHEDTAASLDRAINGERRFPYGIFAGGGEVPLPTVTFDDTYTLTVGSQTLELSFRGPAHEPGNIYVYAPDQRVLMLIDVIFPGWSPFKNLALAEDIPAYFDAHQEILSFDFDTLISGHLGRLGTREDVTIQREYILDIEQEAAAALQAVDFVEIGQETGFENSWLLFDTFFDEVIQTCEEAVVPRWVDRLGAADVFTADHCFVIAESLRID